MTWFFLKFIFNAVQIFTTFSGNWHLTKLRFNFFFFKIINFVYQDRDVRPLVREKFKLHQLIQEAGMWLDEELHPTVEM